MTSHRMDDLRFPGPGAQQRPGLRAALRNAGLAMLLAVAVPASAGTTAGLGASAEAAQRALAARPMKTLEGRALSLASLQGGVVVVNFWASWCPPCRREMPRLGKLHRDLAPSGGRVVAISIDRDVENARRFCRTQGVTVPVVHDGPDGLARQLDLRSVPLTLVLDPAGRVAFSTTGSDDDAMAQVEAAVRRLQGSAAASAGSDGAR